MTHTRLAIMAAAAMCCAVAQAEPKDSIRTDGLREVEVRPALKEVDDAQQRPTAQTLLSGSELQRHQVRTLKHISAMAPGLYMPDYGSRLTSAIYIRGIGSRTGSPAVGLYVDDVPYLDKSAFDFNLYDVERIEVLRGPQGTLYGRNTMGGLIRVQTRSPFDYQGTELRAGYATGNHHRHVSATHYHRPSGKFAFSGGGYYEGASGFFKNDLTGKRVDDMLSAGTRWHGIWRPTDRWNIDITASYDFSNEGAYPYYYTGTTTAAVPDGSAVGKITANRESSYRRSMLNAGVSATYRKDGYSFHSVTAGQWLKDKMLMDQDFIAADLYTLEQRQNIGTFTEELSVKNEKNARWRWTTGLCFTAQANTTQAPVTFYADGVQMLQDNINRVFPDLTKQGIQSMALSLTDPTLRMGGEFDTPVYGLAAFHQSTVKLADHWALVAGLRLDYERNTLRYHSPAAMNYDFTMQSRMPIPLNGQTASTAFDGTLHHDYVRLLPKVAVRYDIDKHNNIYASLSRGTRCGGYNVQMFSDVQQASLRKTMMDDVRQGCVDYIEQMKRRGMPAAMAGMIQGAINDNMPTFGTLDVDETVTYKPEESWNTELGAHLQPVKSLHIDASLFCINTHNQQISRFAPSGLGRMMVNAGRSRSMGGELSASYFADLSASSALSLRAAYGYTHATFTDYDERSAATVPGGSAAGQDYTGNRVPFAPQHTLSADAAYTFRPKQSKLHALTAALNTTALGRLYWTEDNSVCQPFYALLNASLTLDFGKASLTLWGKNLTGTHYNTFYFVSSSRGYEQHGHPAQGGVDIRLRF